MKQGVLIGLGSRLNKMIGDSGETPESFAERLEIDRRTLYNYIGGKTIPNAEMIALICGEYGVSADWLLGLE